MEDHPVLRQPVDIRRQEEARTVEAHVAPAQVVGEDEDDVRFLSLVDDYNQFFGPPA